LSFSSVLQMTLSLQQLLPRFAVFYIFLVSEQPVNVYYSDVDILYQYHFLSVLFLVVEQVDHGASLYSTSIQSHHICLLVKDIDVSFLLRLLDIFSSFHSLQ
jgi:hypothetical protein